MTAGCTLPARAIHLGSIAILALAACSTETSRWQIIDQIRAGARMEAGVVALDRGRMLMLGGIKGQGEVTDEVLLYDLDARAWSMRAPMPERLHHLNAAVVGDRVFVVGALLGLEFYPTEHVYSYDPARDTWDERKLAPTGLARGASGVVAMGDAIYVMGGSAPEPSERVSLYHVADDTWKSLPDLPAPAYHSVGASVDGVVYCVGGFVGPASSPSTKVYALGAGATQWIERSSLRVPMGGCASGVYGAHIICAGGEGEREMPYLQVVQIYDAAGDSWLLGESLPMPVAATNGAIMGQQFIVPGGLTTDPLHPNATVLAYSF